MTEKDIEHALGKIHDDVMDHSACKEVLRSLVSQAYEEAARIIEQSLDDAEADDAVHVAIATIRGLKKVPAS